MTEQKRNSASDEDWVQALEEVEELTVTERAEEDERHREAVKSLNESAKRKIKMLCRERGMDEQLFKAALADRADDRKHYAKKQKRAAKIPDDKIEYWSDVAGQYNWLPPTDEAAPQAETFTERANRERIEAIARITEQEQDEGEQALAELAGAVH